MSDSNLVHQLEDIDAMFVQTARAVERVGERMVLRGITPSTLFFSDRPRRVVGHIDTDQFIEIWDQGDDSFASDPPNAVLAILGNGRRTPEDIVIEISDPVLSGDDLSYVAKELEGTLPDLAGGCSLFIDTFGRPLTPFSVAGMRRRTRRRTRRRAALY